MQHSPTPLHGFSILRRRQELKLDFDQTGKAGRISFAKACISSGLTQPDEIVAEASAISGKHIEGEIETLLMEGEDIHWRKSVEGNLELMVHA